MFVNNIKTAIIVAINIPLALLFAFSMLYVRGKSANLLSIGAVDFGIIVDSSVVVVENIYRNLASDNYPDLPIKERILLFVQEIDHALLYSVLIMVCAFVPLFAMTGPEGQLFGPMAQTYAFSLAGALVLALTLTPVLCMLLFKHFKPVQENLLVRALKFRYLWKLQLCLRYPKTTCAVMAFLIGGTACLIPQLGREFMPELEEGNLWLRGIGPLNMNLDHQVAIAKQARAIMASYPEVESIVTQSGRPDDGTDTEGYYSGEYFVPLRPQKDWPKLMPADRLAAVDLGPDARADETRNRRCDERRPGARHSWHRRGTFRRTSATMCWRRCRGSRGTIPSRSSARTSTSWSCWPPRPRTSCKTSRASPTWASSTSAGRRTWSSASIRRSARSGA